MMEKERREEERREEERREEWGGGRGGGRERESRLYLPHAHAPRRYSCRAVAARVQSCARGGTPARMAVPARAGQGPRAKLHIKFSRVS
jgi:hypothetical protein